MRKEVPDQGPYPEEKKNHQMRLRPLLGSLKSRDRRMEVKIVREEEEG